MQSITPFLWFNDNAREAMEFYVSTFPNSTVGKITYYGESGPGPKGSVMTCSFSLNGVEFVALNGGPVYSFSPATSFVVNCDTQQEVDHYWDRLSEGGETQQCGWLTDKFGVTWQIVPTVLSQLVADENAERTQRVMAAMMQMIKLDIAELERAYNGS